MSAAPSPPQALHRLELSAQTDGELLAEIKRSGRSSGDAPCLVVTALPEGDFDNRDALAEWIGALADLPLPVLAVATGPIGPRGWAVVLCADLTVLGPSAELPDRWRDAPGTAALLHGRLGPQIARTLLFGAAPDPLAILVDAGLATRSENPSPLVEEIAAALGTPVQSRRRKRALRAAAQLPFQEALAFDLWFGGGAREADG